MPVNKSHLYEPGIYFVTFTNYKWLRLFEITNSYDLVYKWFDALKKDGHHVTGYVIMPNHIHALIGFVPGDKSINTIIGNGKRFMAYEIVNRLCATGYEELLTEMAEGVNESDKKKGQQHKIFEPTFEVKLCNSYKFINQKLAYIHANPLSKKWSLVDYAGDYKHSSAGYYESGKQGVYEVMHIDDCINAHWFDRYSGVE